MSILRAKSNQSFDSPKVFKKSIDIFKEVDLVNRKNVQEHIPDMRGPIEFELKYCI